MLAPQCDRSTDKRHRERESGNVKNEGGGKGTRRQRANAAEIAVHLKDAVSVVA